MAMQLFDSKLRSVPSPLNTYAIFFTYDEIAALPVTKSQVGK